VSLRAGRDTEVEEWSLSRVVYWVTGELLVVRAEFITAFTEQLGVGKFLVELTVDEIIGCGSMNEETSSGSDSGSGDAFSSGVVRELCWLRSLANACSAS
jgi:hypothetical protein